MWVTINGKVEQKELEAALEERTGCPYIVVGPARFTNHDCDSNARLVTCDSFSIGVEAKRKIHPGEEITASYGEHYFGDTGEGSGNKLETERGSIRSGVTVLQLQKEEREHWVAACSSSTSRRRRKAKTQGRGSILHEILDQRRDLDANSSYLHLVSAMVSLCAFWRSSETAPRSTSLLGRLSYSPETSLPSPQPGSVASFDTTPLKR
jgi:SET domain